MSTESFSPATGKRNTPAPKAVREYEIMRIAAVLGGDDPVASAKAAMQCVLAWAKIRCGADLPQEAWRFEDFEYYSGGRNCVGIRFTTDECDVWALRHDDPDKTVPGRSWTHEVVVAIMGGQPPRFSMRQLVSTREDDMMVAPHTPGFIQQIADGIGLFRWPRFLKARPWIIESAEEADRLIDLMIDPERRLPLFVLTLPDGAADRQALTVNADSLARAVLGTAIVVVLPSAFTWMLTDRFGKVRSVFGGAARAYLAGFTSDANPYAHRLVLADQLANRDEAAQCERWMRSMAATESIRWSRMGNEVEPFASIRSASSKARHLQLVHEGASEEDRLLAAEVRINALEIEIEHEKAAQLYFATEHEKAEERADGAEAQVRASASRIQQLLAHISERGGQVDADNLLPNSWNEFASWCDTQLAGRLVLSSVARRNVRAPEFGDVYVAARSLLWLATICRDRKITGGEGSLGEEVVDHGVRNAHCGNDQFDVDWTGTRHTADWHIKSGGNTRDPARCLRIYYFWDAVSQQIVVADMPAHRRTGAS